MRVIHVLRKPLSEKTVAANVLKHGTGGLNIDASRIASPGEKITTHTQGRGDDGYAANAVYGDYRGGFSTHQTEGQKLGRWPANVILQHLDGCRCDEIDKDGKETVANGVCEPGCPVARLDEQSGVLHSRFFKQLQAPDLATYLKTMTTPHDGAWLHVVALHDVAWSTHADGATHAVYVDGPELDAGLVTEVYRILRPGAHLLLSSPPRQPTGHLACCLAEDAGFEVRDAILLADSVSDQLHYVPKASRKEREAGLHDLPSQLFGASGGAQGAISGGEDYDQAQGIGLNRVTQRRNIHPTVKPIEVMRRLLVGIEAPVLDPFVGSGTTMLACIASGLEGIGIEREDEYVAIARARVGQARG